MVSELTVSKGNFIADPLSVQEHFLQIRVDGQLFGIPVVRVRDVLKPQKVTRIPLAKPEIAGFMNLRGRIVTVINMRKRLNSENSNEPLKKMFVVVESENELYSLQVDEVGDTKTLPIKSFENTPENMNKLWKNLCRGVFKLEKDLMLVLDIGNLVNF